MRKIYLGLLPVLLAACDPAGHLRVAVVRDGPGPAREPIADATVWMECPSGGKTKLMSTTAAGQFLGIEIPAIGLDCVVSIETPEGTAGRYRVRDLCVDETLKEGYGCRKAFLYATVRR